MHFLSFLLVFFSGVLIGGAVSVYIYRKLYPAIISASSKFEHIVDDLRK